MAESSDPLTVQNGPSAYDARRPKRCIPAYADGHVLGSVRYGTMRKGAPFHHLHHSPNANITQTHLAQCSLATGVGSLRHTDDNTPGFRPHNGGVGVR